MTANIIAINAIKRCKLLKWRNWVSCTRKATAKETLINGMKQQHCNGKIQQTNRRCLGAEVTTQTWLLERNQLIRWREWTSILWCGCQLNVVLIVIYKFAFCMQLGLNTVTALRQHTLLGTAPELNWAVTVQDRSESYLQKQVQAWTNKFGEEGWGVLGCHKQFSVTAVLLES